MGYILKAVITVAVFLSAVASIIVGGPSDQQDQGPGGSSIGDSTAAAAAAGVSQTEGRGAVVMPAEVIYDLVSSESAPQEVIAKLGYPVSWKSSVVEGRALIYSNYVVRVPGYSGELSVLLTFLRMGDAAEWRVFGALVTKEY